MFSKIDIILTLCVILAFERVLSLAIFSDAGSRKQSERGGRQRQLNDLPTYEDDYSVSRYRDSLSQWESAEWPKTRRDDNSYDTEDRPYDWFYYNKYLTNGRFNHLYNGPNNDDQAGMGEPGFRNSPPRILPRPVPSFGRTSKPKKWNE